MFTLILIMMFLYIATKKCKSMDINTLAGCVAVIDFVLLFAVLDVDNKNPEVQLVRQFIINNVW